MSGFGQSVAQGLNIAGWVIGFCAGVGAFAFIVGLFCWCMTTVLGKDDGEDEP